VVRRLRWTLLDQGELETQEEEAAGAASTGVEAGEALTEEKAGDEVVMAVTVAEDTEERAAMVVVVAVDSVETVEAEDAASTGAEAGVAWMETEVMVVVLIGDVVAMVAVVVVAVATVAARVEDMREVVEVAGEGEASRMPMDSRSRTTKCLRLVSHPCFETIISQNEDTHLTKQPPPKTQKQNVA